jgi:hypothetical protein
VRGSVGLCVGLVVGGIVGAGAMYLTLRPPWGGEPLSLPDPGPVATAPPDAGVPGKSKPKRRHGAGRPGAGGGAGGGAADGDDVDPAPIVLTAADRRLEWRGDDVTLPPRKLDMTSGSEARPLDDAEINAAFSQASGVRECVAQSATGTDLRATITVKLIVDGGTGRVTRSRLEAPRYLFEHGLLACAQRALGRMKFPATGAPTLITIPVNLG